MNQFLAKFAIRQTLNELFPFAIRPVREDRHPDKDVVRVLEEIAHHVIIRGEL
jgi:hypothetical protein